MNFKGEANFGMFLGFFILVAIIMGAGLFIIVGSSAVNYAMDIIAPEVSSIGMLGSANMTTISSYAITPLNTLVQGFVWLTGALYFITFFGLFALAIGFKATMSKWMIPLFLLMAVLMLFASIFISNMYQDMYTTNDDVTIIMKEHVLLSWLILHQPMIFTVIILTSGIIMFSGMKEEDMI